MDILALLRSLGLSSGISALLFYGLNLFLPLTTYQGFFWICIGVFCLLNALIFIMGFFERKKKSGNTFLAVIVYSFLLKIITFIALIAQYKLSFIPESNLFIVGFFICYISFTYFEVTDMLRQSQSPPLK